MGHVVVKRTSPLRRHWYAAARHGRQLENPRPRRRAAEAGVEHMNDLVIRMPWPGKQDATAEAGLNYEWLVTNGLGGYASGTLSGVITRRYHGYLVAALPVPFGRIMMLNDLVERIELPDGGFVQLAGEERAGGSVKLDVMGYLSEFRREPGPPVWPSELCPPVL